MKLITATIRPWRLDDVREAVAAMGLQGMTITETEEYGVREPHTEVYRGAEYRVEWAGRIRLELAVDDVVVDQVVEAICNIARTGRRGDGRITVAPLAEALRIRTGEMGRDAL
ncbi:MAG: P-II family nitrogen regulator [Steroidobacteraceae bacterium]|nr:P-II family nitrogen regulator [Steroidobacteraceae bacterium]MCC7199063.1 P-II family nitrogen regulator [Gammaproteobacteria bacterium]